MPAAHAGGSPRPLGTEVRGAPRGLRLGTEVGGAPRGRWVQRSGGLPEASGWGQRSGGLPEASGWGQRSAGLPEAAGDRGQGGSPRPPAGDRGRRGSPRPLAGDRGRRGSPRPLGTEVGGAPRGRWGQRSGGLPEASGWGQRSFKSYRSTWPPGSRECWHQPSKSHETRNGIRGLIFTARVMSQRLLAPVVALEDLGTAPRDKLHWVFLGPRRPPGCEEEVSPAESTSDLPWAGGRGRGCFREKGPRRLRWGAGWTRGLPTALGPAGARVPVAHLPGAREHEPLGPAPPTSAHLLRSPGWADRDRGSEDKGALAFSCW
ncbi:collagen alpha-1(III) chain-like isoform X1 [Suricata suricatta]|uniref:collagen alpha-1(III) chain-like isoform X1 n=1 Tax=Suricata suricatta TaxID=37032 RepID=UPI0011553925|nr:collagen alpha-1(III) chain-like isoform X1 [Suricata suricatta]